MAASGYHLGPRLRAALCIPLFFGCAAFAGVGATVAFIDPTRPRVVGAAVMVAASVIGVTTVRYWRRVLPAVFACGALNAIMIVADGHGLNSPTVPVPRPVGVLLTLEMVAAAVLTAAANRRRFGWTERLSFSGVFLCCAVLFSAFDLQIASAAGALFFASIPLIASLLTRALHTSPSGPI